MKTAEKDYIINTVFRGNILPITSKCNTSCIFCSNRYNPMEVEAYKLPQLTMEDFKELVTFLSPDRKIVIGEAATRIIEGEPLTHGNFIDILVLLRKRFRKTTIQITTNGILLDEGLIRQMEDIGGIELNISVNCVDPEKRQKVLGLKHPDGIMDKVSMLKGRVRFSGSFVWVPEIMDDGDMEDMIKFLDSSGADSVRMFLPGYTSRAEAECDFNEMFHRARHFVEGMRGKYGIPIILEPYPLEDLECRIEGVIRGTSAWEYGLKQGDVLRAVNGESVLTRVDAFNKAYRLASPVLRVARCGGIMDIKIQKKADTSPGFIVLYDIDPGTAQQVQRVVRNNSAKDVLFVTSELAVDILGKFFVECGFEFNYDILCARNLYFGGTIKCAGLLTVGDIVEAAQKYLENRGKPDLIILPPSMFDFRKKDITGRSIHECEDILGIKVDTTIGA